MKQPFDFDFKAITRTVIRDNGLTLFGSWIDRMVYSLLRFAQMERIRPVPVFCVAHAIGSYKKTGACFSANTPMLSFGIPDGRHGATERLNQFDSGSEATVAFSSRTTSSKDSR